MTTMRPTSVSSTSNSSMSSAFSDYSSDDNIHNTSANTSQQFFAKLVRDTRSKVGQKTSEINATMQEKLPEWKSRSVMYSNKAKEASIEWGRKGKEAVDRWKKERLEAQSSSSITSYRPMQQSTENSIFGMPLELAVALTKIHNDDLVPGIFRKCIDYLNHVGIHETGIYRISGSTLAVNKLRDEFNEGINVNFEETCPDPHVVGALLKLYLRELPEPIIPPDYTLQFTAILKDEDPLPQLLKAIQSILSKLSIYNFCILQLLCQHLKRVADNEKDTKMSVSNLVLIFIPTLNIDRTLFQYMIEHYHELFENGNGKKPAGPANVPPPLPQKPRNLLIDMKSMTTGTPKKVAHTKTMSDTDMYIHTIKNNLSKVPPPKPSRSPASASNQTSRQPPPLPPSKPRSKSVSSPIRRDNTILSSTPPMQTHLEDTIWTQRGRVEAIGKQFETLINKTQTIPYSRKNNRTFESKIN